jgi:hypothetical protein
MSSLFITDVKGFPVSGLTRLTSAVGWLTRYLDVQNSIRISSNTVINVDEKSIFSELGLDHHLPKIETALWRTNHIHIMRRALR